ncbi:hypothetical protein AGOR_G00198480 [Albula goreensis]|uniref:Globoside alpha-1,3-N-acetylgalactosaminyltransferase 1-like n=1 Tax=Albula goreensis TaxID=1534307 RepID=A0A8T3CNH2_9TELE|nr:hypothetical protein AGOR_G00198480 [Albula goreensis]
MAHMTGRVLACYFSLLIGGVLLYGIFILIFHPETIRVINSSISFRNLCLTNHPASPHEETPKHMPPSPKKFYWRLKNHPLFSTQRLQYEQPRLLKPVRTDVLTVTPWMAPIVWEGTFDRAIIDNAYKPLNLTIATTVFAVGKYTRFLRDFLSTAEQHYMVGLKVHYYIFTDQPSQVPEVALPPGREVTVIQVPKFNRWQEISLRRMEIIQTAIEERIHREADYIYCLDVDMKFHNRWGPEVLDTLVAAIHPWFYYLDREHFTYERRPSSKAYIPVGQGDFYYMGAVFGGRVEDVHKLTKTCREHLEEDKKLDLEAVWQEESHLNWYLLHNKPSKLLSPEYLWDDLKGQRPVEIKVIRFSAIIKNKGEVRENV